MEKSQLGGGIYMKLFFRLLIVIALFSGIVLLSGSGSARAGGTAQWVSQSGTANLTGLVWEDKDRDGLQDIGESGIPNVNVELYDSNKVLVTMVLTDTNGQYKFEGLAPGNYSVHFIVPAGLAISQKDQGRNEAVDSDADLDTAETAPVTLTAGENTHLWDAGLYTSAGLLARHDPGTVKPPPRTAVICKSGVTSLGGISTLKVSNLAKGYCLFATLWKHNFAVGRIPDGAGKILTDITFLGIFKNGRFVSDLPTDKGQVQICYAAPPGKTVQIYFLDFYGPRFGRPGQRNWVPLETTVANGLACAPAQSSGAYALIGK
jgi:hypothetical protein